MVFSHLVFLFCFLPIVLISYFLAPKFFKNIILLIASLFFYAWGEPIYIFLMLFSIQMNYFLGRLIGKDPSKKRGYLILAIVGNVLILGFFKYADFFITNVNRFFGTSLELLELPLPIGISFFTFQAMSYVIDVYRKEVEPQRNLIALALYISFFPQLVAGPIVRYHSINEQLKRRHVTLEKFSDGVRRFITGLAKKVLLANGLGEVADAVFNSSVDEMSLATAWVGIAAYTLQIYFDFSGYSDMAIGLGKMFGFDFLENFRYPYISTSVSEFWKRWHISLGSWFRDYVYIPLGGNRGGWFKTIRNLLIVWTITGFWHGSSWTFMAWGFYYGVLITLERLGMARVLTRLWKPVQHLYLLWIVMIGWVFFRADDFSYSLSYIQRMFGIGVKTLVDSESYLYMNDYWYLFLFGIAFSLPVWPYMKEKLTAVFQWKPTKVLTPIISTVFYMLLMVGVMIQLVNSTYNPFIYFRF
ncbi:MBOAT family O-acyltransferase [Halobacillus karajensis]|uniref:D-alanyl-lipoteichoic acid biosynthesis protein DltB n=1 Tax=Halobacillus karajensis TaxID=195088 RepID=A0A059NVA5_9BACI|nr:MBOAT family O-acyltransferase [Halobacillus karajensis]CDQ18927.1 D-alanyl-lipoteichoic acid biosynthesis protein DltB [Halobacillus karajensis]CDQ23000.1 D-alanyl-lipoteichoic acid biosynthesis protein DltB [Halobacillus karajensis]CDQ26482.1 D-alanyl-lipoteichoic acid biosynthesis protein DltB [Halobacillus karajensis]